MVHKQNIFDELKKEENLEKINLSLLILKEWLLMGTEDYHQ